MCHCLRYTRPENDMVITHALCNLLARSAAIWHMAYITSQSAWLAT